MSWTQSSLSWLRLNHSLVTVSRLPPQDDDTNKTLDGCSREEGTQQGTLQAEGHCGGRREVERALWKLREAGQVAGFLYTRDDTKHQAGCHGLVAERRRRQ